MKWSRFIRERSRRSIIVIGISAVLLLGVVDFVTGPELSFSIFYLLPVALLAWYVGRDFAVVAAALSAVSWLIADALSGHEYSRPIIPYWNALVRFGVFLIVAQILSSLRAAGDRREELRNFIIHDLRSPLGNVSTGLQILREEVEPHLRDLIHMSIASCNRMLTLINSLLDLGRLERGKMPIDLQPTRASELVDASIEQIRMWAAQERIDIDASIAPGDVEVDADRTLVERILVNLLTNAVKHSPAESTVRVRVLPAGPGTVAFHVSDEGAGVPDEWAEKIFDKYAQVEARKSDVRSGSGLGLAYCRLAVEAHGGKIWLESTSEGGTTVTFTLPSAR